MCGFLFPLWEIHYYCQMKRTSCQWVKNGIGVDHQGQHIFQNILLCDASLGNATMCDPEPHHIVKCKSTLLERF
jgi:hypothetical protein